MQFSDAVRNAMLDSFETTTGAAPILRIHSGAMPANCAAARTGTKLVEMTLPSDWMGNASGGTKSKSGTWAGSGTNAGYVGYYSIMDPAGTTCHAQGLVAQPYAVNFNVGLNQQMVNAGNVYQATTAGTTGASSAPTGTGNAIADGTVTWKYLGPVDMNIDNGNINQGQAVAVNTFSITEANA
jgi:hypothetical protein